MELKVLTLNLHAYQESGTSCRNMDGSQTAEEVLKELMADVTRAMEKAQEAVAKITSTAAGATTETESTSR
jgi:hypothetical protein